jgi:hypothetical protein
VTPAGREDDGRMIVQLTAAELRTLIRSEVELALRSQSLPASRWLDIGAAAKHFGCSGQTVRNWIKLGAPARQIGTSAHPQFRLELIEFEAWVRAQGK